MQSSSTIQTVTVQSGRPSSKIAISEEAKRDVNQAYLVSQRQRFKNEINRLTRGEMLRMLKQKSSAAEYAEQLGFLMSYVYAWHWLQQNINTQYQAEVLKSFCKGAQAFLMEMLLQSRSSAEFVQSYIRYWQQYQGDVQLQQQNLLSLLQLKQTPDALTEFIESVWGSLKLFDKSFDAGYKELAKQEKDRYADMLADEDRERLALVDQLPDTEAVLGRERLGFDAVV